MKTVYFFLIAFFLGFSKTGWTSTTASSTITYTVGSIIALSISGNPAPFNITSATAGSPLSPVTDTSTTYAVTSNITAQRITALLATTLPSGVTLSVTLSPPAGATSTGAVSLTTISQALVTGISNVAHAGLGITYVFAATLSAAPVTAATNTITYTIGP